jgi:hypothetical protein
MRMKRKKLVAVIVLVLALVAWTFRPYPTIDATKVHPSLRGLDDSAECGWSSFGDGGSVAIIIRRPGGAETELCLSNSLGQSIFERGDLYIGSSYFSDPGSTKIVGYDHSKYVVAKLLAKGIPQHPSVRAKIALLTMRASDWISSFIHGAGSPLW